jgi:hypothetical protein
LAELGCVTSIRNIEIVIHRAGFRYRQARVALTSHDPEYEQKVSADQTHARQPSGRGGLLFHLAPWHESKALLAQIQFLNEWAEHDTAPEMILRPLPSPACAEAERRAVRSNFIG